MLEPTWKLEQKADGPTLVVGGYTVHPGDMPRRTARLNAMESATIVMRQNGKKVVLVGFGLGYLAEELMNVLPQDVAFYCWDCLPVAVIERSAKFKELQDRGMKVLHLEEEVLLVLGDDTFVVPHAAAADLFIWELSMAEAEFNRRQAKTTKAVSKRSKEFLEWLPRVGLVQEHYGLGKGRTCLLVSPGPNLNLELVKKMRDEGYPLICCAQAVAKLNGAGIVPDATVCLDPQPAVYEQLKKGSNPGWVYADAMSDGRVWQDYHEQAFAFTVPTSHCHALVWRELGYDWMEIPSVTVSELMLEICWKMGFHSVVTSGIDYCSKERTERHKLECKGGVWTDGHYYGGSKAWRFMSRRFSLPTLQIEDFVGRNMVMKQEPLKLPPPANRVPESLVQFHLRQMLGTSAEQIQAELLKQIPEGCRQDFAPISSVGVPVVKQS